MSNISNFVPKHLPALDSDIKLLKNFIQKSKNLLVLTGAGISTESGIPDYRSAEVGLEARRNYTPVQFNDYVTSAYTRKKYWARSFVEWPRISQVQPNSVHCAIRDLEVVHKKVTAVVTQNIDRLHTKAGSKNVVELHGHGHTVMCLGCDLKIDRHEFQEKLAQLNPQIKNTSEFILPDGDVEFKQDQLKNFVMPNCSECGGILKPEIIFFGENIPEENFMLASNYLEQSDALLILGSSLVVSSGFGICMDASSSNKPIAIVNIGQTEGDPLAQLKISAKCGDVLPKAIGEIGK